eukprot:scaffold104323_cov61-Attheya_sp.AAC.3
MGDFTLNGTDTSIDISNSLSKKMTGNPPENQNGFKMLYSQYGNTVTPDGPIDAIHSMENN